MQIHSKGEASSGRETIPRFLRILDRVVSAYAPGGRVAWAKRRNLKGKKNPPPRKEIKVKIPPEVEAQKASVRKILMPNGRLIRREVAQFALSMGIQIFESFPKFFLQTSFEAQLTLIETMNSWQESDFTKRAKALTVWGFARLMKQDLPSVPDPAECRNLGFKGKAAQWLRNLMVRRSNPKNVRFFWGLLQGTKRGSATISEVFIEENYRKHQKSLTRPLPDQTFDASMAQEFGRNLFRGVRSAEDLPQASFSASFRSTRREGGKIAELRKYATRKEIAITEIDGELQRVSGLNLSEKDALQAYLQSEDRKQTRVRMVLEPLKARPITAGSALGSWCAMRGQKEMWNHLRKLPQCKLIGEPLTKEHLEWVQENSRSDFEFWVSGDYSAATDNLDIRLTKCLFEGYMENAPWLSQEMKILFREMLYEQDLHYPDGSVVGQTNGQLMGSPLSFPILCAANLFAYAEAYWRFSGEMLPLRKLPVLVNGDDILFKASPEFYQIWQQEVKKVGFELSVGKSYFSKKFLTVNSKLYLCRGGAKPDFNLVTFFNPAQVMPLHYLSVEEGPKQGFTDPFQDRLSDALERATDHRLAFDLFLFFNQKLVNQASSSGRFNFFLHPLLGGLGVKAPEGMKFWITRYQRQLAASCLLQQSRAIELTGSSRLEGLVTPSCAKIAVRASVPPAPSKELPSLERYQVQTGDRFWRSNRICIKNFRQIRDSNLPTDSFLKEWVGCMEIAPSEQNDAILLNQQFGDAIGLPFLKASGGKCSVDPECLTLGFGDEFIFIHASMEGPDASLGHPDSI